MKMQKTLTDTIKSLKDDMFEDAKTEVLEKFNSLKVFLCSYFAFKCSADAFWTNQHNAQITLITIKTYKILNNFCSISSINFHQKKKKKGFYPQSFLPCLTPNFSWFFAKLYIKDALESELNRSMEPFHYKTGKTTLLGK